MFKHSPLGWLKRGPGVAACPSSSKCDHGIIFFFFLGGGGRFPHSRLYRPLVTIISNNATIQTININTNIVTMNINIATININTVTSNIINITIMSGTQRHIINITIMSATSTVLTSSTSQ